MADSSLDQFFAKKDRSKKAKSKGKFTTEQIAKKMEDPSKKSEKLSKKEKDKPAVTGGQISVNVPSLEQEDEEWKDFEEEKERDYTGLRIQALSLTDKEKDEENYKDQQDEENGEYLRTQDVQSGPWKISAGSGTQPPSAPVEAPPAPEPEEVKPAPAASGEGEPKKKAAYVPPQRRNPQASSTPTASKRSHASAAPEIDSELHFPSLGAAVETKSGWHSDVTDKSFQSVKHGLRSKEETSYQGIRLDLENKYAALHQGDAN